MWINGGFRFNSTLSIYLCEIYFTIAFYLYNGLFSSFSQTL
ncbi:hypothetical protein HMPREF0518_0119 [Lactobacillus helveticus DSM 20075 = CGMCC 1.1877]|nr:hypothetical protein HMPREF0518_0119 [Lactobacillus helveticus DSM 20075 = CGMCC 1.1877]